MLRKSILGALALGFSFSAVAQTAPSPTGPMSAWSNFPVAATNPQYVASCEKDLPFNQWLADLEKDAEAQGVSQATIGEASQFLVLNPDIVRRDRAQGVFQQSFLVFSDRMISKDRLKKAAKLMVQDKDLFDAVEKKFGVPREVILGFWALESDFGAVTGKFQILTALTSLSYDCRRPGFFRPQLIDALRLVERKDLRADQMVGNWAGELGGTQFTPTDYFKYGVDFDGDGRVDLTTSIPDTIASTANFLMNLGFQRGQPWIQEVHVPAQMPWQEADATTVQQPGSPLVKFAVQHPVSQWAKWGVTAAQGSFPKQDLQATLLLPMGRLGPAFLAYPSFNAYMGWNSAMVYSITSAYLAMRIQGMNPIGRGNGEVAVLTGPQMIELQMLLNKIGLNAGDTDGKMGTATRVAVKAAQMKYGFAADSYPTPELLTKLEAVTGYVPPPAPAQK